MGTVTGIVPEHHWLLFDVETDVVVERNGWVIGNAFKKWKYKGELLRQSDEEISLKVMMDNLQLCIELLVEWNDSMNQYLRFIGENLWRDAGVESLIQLDEIIRLLTANSSVCEQYNAAAQKLLFYMTEVNSPESRQKQVDHLINLSKSDEIQMIIDELGDEAEENADRIPIPLKRLFDRNPQEYIGRLRYLHFPYKQVRQLQTLMAIRIALKRDYFFKNDYVNVGEVLLDGYLRLRELSMVVSTFYQNSTKNLALIYCVLRDRGFLINSKNYLKFVMMLVSSDILSPMSEKRMKSLANGISQYMRDRYDHNKIREGFSSNFLEWNDCKEKDLCLKISGYFS